jgi:hypothetical protein
VAGNVDQARERCGELFAFRQQTVESLQQTWRPDTGIRNCPRSVFGIRHQRQLVQSPTGLGEMVGVAAQRHPLADLRVKHQAGGRIVRVARRKFNENVDALDDADRNSRKPGSEYHSSSYRQPIGVAENAAGG